jgi:hypothetical protein
LLATSAIMLSEKKKRKRKMWSKKWHLKRNISCDANLLNELLRTDVEVECLEMMLSWCWQVNWGSCGIRWVNCAVLCVKDGWKGQFRGLRYCLSKLRSLLSFFRQVWRHTVKSLFNWECVRRFIQGDQKVSVHLMITVQKTRKNILNSFNHLPW